MSTPLRYTYQGISAFALPFVARHRINEIRRAGFDVARAHEVLGHALTLRPLGPLIWCHAPKSEDIAGALRLIEAMLHSGTELRVLLTTPTAQGIDAIAPHVSDHLIHQFAPLDAGGPTARFLKHWRPDFGIFLGKGGGQNMLRVAQGVGLSMAWINARLPFGGPVWSGRMRPYYERFKILQCTDAARVDAMEAIGAPHARQGVDPAALPPPSLRIDTLDQARLVRAFAERPLWSAIGVYPKEEALVISALRQLRRRQPDTALILQPRDQAQTASIRAKSAGLVVAEPNEAGPPNAETAIYLAKAQEGNTNWYGAAPVCVLGGAFAGKACDTPLCAIRAGAVPIHGGRAAHLGQVFGALDAARASVAVSDAAALAAALDDLLTHPERRAGMIKRGQDVIQEYETALAQLASEILSCAGLADD